MEKDQHNRSLAEELKSTKAALHSKEGINTFSLHVWLIIRYFSPFTHFYTSVEVRHLKDELQVSASVVSLSLSLSLSCFFVAMKN